MVSILKIPFESGLVDKTRLGAAEAPNAIQKEFGKHNTNWVNIPVSSDIEQTHSNIFSKALEEYNKGNTVIGLGGDHSVTYSLFKAFKEKFKGGLICFDAHLDCQEDFTPPSHEDVIGSLIRNKIILPKDLLMIGTRKWSPKEKEFADKHNLNIINENILTEVKEFCKDKDNIYLSIDIDAIDPKFAPGTGYLEKNGLSLKTIQDVVLYLKAHHKLKGGDLVEISPKRDASDKTVKLGSEILFKLIS